MDHLNFDEYISKNKPSRVEFKIVKDEDRCGVSYHIKFKKYIQRVFNTPKITWATVCYASYDSGGGSWCTKTFDNYDEAELFVNKLCKVPRSEVVVHVERDISYGKEKT